MGLVSDVHSFRPNASRAERTLILTHLVRYHSSDQLYWSSMEVASPVEIFDFSRVEPLQDHHLRELTIRNLRLALFFDGLLEAVKDERTPLGSNQQLM
jgi:hypothetical protein